MDEQEEYLEKARQLPALMEQARERLKQDRRWSYLPLKWLMLWHIRWIEWHIQKDTQESEYTYHWRRGPTSISFHWPWR